MTNPEQRWRPIALMPAFKYAVVRAAESTRDQARNMRMAAEQPQVIDRFELARMRIVYQDTALYAHMCSEQVQRWRGECATSEQSVALDQLDAVLMQWSADTKAVIDAVNALLQRVDE